MTSRLGSKRIWSRCGANASSETTKRRRIIPKPERNCPGKLQLQHHDYTVAWICALHIEKVTAWAMLEVEHENLPAGAHDSNSYVLGSIGQHNIVVACLPADQYGTNNAAAVTSNLMRSFPSIRVGLMVGIGGGAPRTIDLRLGDVVVGNRVMQYDLGKVIEDCQIQRTGVPRSPKTDLSTAVSKLRAVQELTLPSRLLSILGDMLGNHPAMTEYAYPRLLQDRLFRAEYPHNVSATSCADCDISMLAERPSRTDTSPKIHYGGIASGSPLMRDGISRDRIAGELGVICFEMEAAGLTDILPCLVVRGICDYSDSHENKRWQKYAAATAAAYAKELLLTALPATANRVSLPVTSTARGSTMHFICSESR